MTPTWLSGRLIRYLIAGGTTFVIEYGLFIGLYYDLHAQINVALTIGFLVALVIGFAFNHQWAFRSERGRAHHQFAAYAALALLNLAFTNISVPLLHSLGLAPAIGKIFAQGCVVIWNYLILRKIIFRVQ